ncbi:hypothetical protein EDC25_10180 [Pseudofulvimonas gallinarii]|jgi:hypothetical protein|uniref:SMc04008-like domain-containing protein n=2 Tax=Pseudofulvimonas gallinarii TaxID=634155 RepID=A0A4R3LRQ5_9GAMM|nr:hypothetical protein EDC25_10180 [Pseudofulvimonas gallinarii]
MPSAAPPPYPTIAEMDMELDDRFAAAAFRRLLGHLRSRPEVQNIDLMILAGFCRNCLADWYRDAATAGGPPLDREAARELVYGEPFADWRMKHQREATPEQLAAFEASQRRHSVAEPGA